MLPILLLFLLVYVLSFFLPGRLKSSGIKSGQPLLTAKSLGLTTTGSQLQFAFGKLKHLPEGYEEQALIALSFYPELKETDIEFRLGAFAFAHTCRPKIVYLLNPFGPRRYLITISRHIEGPLVETLFKNLPFDAQVGVLGHELAHILDYETKSSAALIRDGVGYGFYNFRKQFENATDLRTIEKGLGYQLLVWSQTVHPLLTADGRGELYYSPDQIRSEIAKLPAYEKIHSSEKGEALQ